MALRSKRTEASRKAGGDVRAEKPSICSGVQPRAAGLNKPTSFQAGSASSRNPGTHRESSVKRTGLHFPESFEPLPGSTSSSRAFPQRLYGSRYSSRHDASVLPLPSCSTPPAAQRRPSAHFRSVTYFRFAGRAVDGLKRRAWLSLWFRGSGAQHGYLTSFLHGTDLSSLWRGTRRGLGAGAAVPVRWGCLGAG